MGRDLSPVRKVRSQHMSPSELIDQYLIAIQPIEDECGLLVERLRARDKALHIMSHEMGQHFPRPLYLLTTGEPLPTLAVTATTRQV